MLIQMAAIYLIDNYEVYYGCSISSMILLTFKNIIKIDSVILIKTLLNNIDFHFQFKEDFFTTLSIP